MSAASRRVVEAASSASVAVRAATTLTSWSRATSSASRTKPGSWSTTRTRACPIAHADRLQIVAGGDDLQALRALSDVDDEMTAVEDRARAMRRFPQLAESGAGLELHGEPLMLPATPAADDDIQRRIDSLLCKRGSGRTPQRPASLSFVSGPHDHVRSTESGGLWACRPITFNARPSAAPYAKCSAS